MGIKKYNPTTPGLRGMTVSTFEEITAEKPEKSLTVTLKKHSGRNNRGVITVRHRGGGYRPKYRIIDFKRDKDGIPGNVKTPRQLKWYTPEGEAEIVAAQCLDGRIMPVDVAALAMFLASDDARYCTGHDYFIDAGWR